MPPESSCQPRLANLLSLFFLFFAAAWFYAWAPASYPARWITQNPSGWYPELTDAFLQGHLYLKRTPAAGLLALSDPYDPTQNTDFRINDLSFFKGHYYLYHGIAPVLMLLLPIRLLIGFNLTETAASLLLCIGGAASSLLILWHLWRKNFFQASRLSLMACVVAMLFCHGYYLVLRGAGINQVAIASAYFFWLLTIWAVLHALTVPTLARRWLLFAGLAYGLAIASRPNYVFGAVALAIPAMLSVQKANKHRSRVIFLNFASVALPLGLIVGAVLVHNYIRFGQALEFGQRYMLGAWDQRHLGFLGLKNAASNAWSYLFTPGELSLEFPFLSAPDWQAVGAFVQTPFVWLSVSAICLLGVRDASSPGTPFRPLAGVIAISLMSNLGLLICLPSGNAEAVQTSANARYTFDFLPALVLLSCLGVLHLDHYLRRGRHSMWWWQTSIATLTLLSLLAALSLDFQRFPIEGYRRFARVLNWPAYLAQRCVGIDYGPIELTLIFPEGKQDYEPLIATGSFEAGDLLYAVYDSPGTIRFGLVGTSMKGPLSPAIPITYGKAYRLGVKMGSLYPSLGHPLMGELSDAEVAHLARTLQIELNGSVVYEVPAHFSLSKPTDVRIGSNELLRAYSALNFSGRILSTRRLPIAPVENTKAATMDYGAIRMTAKFPEKKIGALEPLVVSGVQNAGDFIYVRYENDREISLGLDHWGGGGQRTHSLPIDYSIDHVIGIKMGSLFPPKKHILLSHMSEGQVTELKKRVEVTLDGKTVLDFELPTFDSSPYDIFIGRNIIGGSTCQYEFTGQIKSVTRVPLKK